MTPQEMRDLLDRLRTIRAVLPNQEGNDHAISMLNEKIDWLAEKVTAVTAE